MWIYVEVPKLDPQLVTNQLDSKEVTKPMNQASGTSSVSARCKSNNNSKVIGYRLHQGNQAPYLASYIILVKKENGQIRCCVDFRNLNIACQKNEFPYLTLRCWSMELLVTQCSPLMIVSVVIIRSRLHPYDVEKFVFRTRMGNFHYTVMPCDLTMLEPQ